MRRFRKTSIERALKTRGHFPTDEAATKLICLALRNITGNWERAAPTWRLYEGRFTKPAVS